MRRIALCLSLAFAAEPAIADALVAVRTIRARETIAADDVRLVAGDIPGALRDPAAAIGREARQTIYEGRPVAASAVADAAVVERNDLVVLTFDVSGLVIRADGRALGRGPVGARVRVMNLASRNTVTGTVLAPGSISVP